MSIRKKYRFFIQNNVIVLNDDDDLTLDEINSKLRDLISSNYIVSIKTDKDLLIARSHDIRTIHVQQYDSKSKNNEEEESDGPSLYKFDESEDDVEQKASSIYFEPVEEDEETNNEENRSYELKNIDDLDKYNEEDIESDLEYDEDDSEEQTSPLDTTNMKEISDEEVRQAMEDQNIDLNGVYNKEEVEKYKSNQSSADFVFNDKRKRK